MRMFRKLIVNVPWNAHPADVDRYCREVKDFGATTVIVNLLPDAFHPGLIDDPANECVTFFDWGPSLDMYFSTELNRDIWPAELLARNRKALLTICRVVREHGMKPMLLIGEPRYQPERFFQKNPHLRGPRVDNPGVSTVAYYAPCVDSPEVQEHYRELMRQMMESVPDLEGMFLYNGDSGTGLCHSERLYAGTNGPRWCRTVPAGERFLRFVNLLLESARSVNPEFGIWLFYYVLGREREYVLDHSAAPVSSIVLSGYHLAFSLDDWSASHEYGPKIDTMGYEKAFSERVEKITQSAASLTSQGKTPIVDSSLPVEEWIAPLRTVPCPFQTLQILEGLQQAGSRDVFFYGHCTDPAVVPYDVNRKAIQVYVGSANRSPDHAVQQVAREWVPSDHAESLVTAWRLCDQAYRQRPLWVWSFGFKMQLFPGPLVPDASILDAGEKTYYYNARVACTDRIPGSDYRSCLRHEESYRSWMLHRYEGNALNFLKEAMDGLRVEAGRAHCDDAGMCLASQFRQIGVFECWLRSQYNWLEAGRFLAPGEGQATAGRSLPEIIDDEIENTRTMAELTDGHVEELFDDTYRPLFSFEDTLKNALETRIQVMRTHRADPVNPYRGAT